MAVSLLKATAVLLCVTLTFLSYGVVMLLLFTGLEVLQAKTLFAAHGGPAGHYGKAQPAALAFFAVRITENYFKLASQSSKGVMAIILMARVKSCGRLFLRQCGYRVKIPRLRGCVLT